MVTTVTIDKLPPLPPLAGGEACVALGGGVMGTLTPVMLKQWLQSSGMAFVGAVTAPTAPLGDASTAVATTAFVTNSHNSMQFLAAGSFTVPAGVTKILVYSADGGTGGNGGGTGTAGTAGGITSIVGLMPAATGVASYTVVPGTVYPVTVGVGGTGGTGGTGVDLLGNAVTGGAGGAGGAVGQKGSAGTAGTSGAAIAAGGAVGAAGAAGSTAVAGSGGGGGGGGYLVIQW